MTIREELEKRLGVAEKALAKAEAQAAPLRAAVGELHDLLDVTPGYRVSVRTIPGSCMHQLLVYLSGREGLTKHAVIADALEIPGTRFGPLAGRALRSGWVQRGAGVAMYEITEKGRAHLAGMRPVPKGEEK